MAFKVPVYVACLMLVAVLLYLVIFVSTNAPSKTLSVDHFARVHCPLSQETCSLSLGKRQLRVALSPLGLPAMEPLSLALEAVGFDLNSDALIWFEGRDMNMGQHFFLSAPVVENRPTQADFQGMIPICGIDTNMVWLLNVQIEHAEERFRFVFELSSESL